MTDIGSIERLNADCTCVTLDVEKLCRALEKVSPIPVHTVDESFSSAYADDDLFSRGFTAERVTKLRDAMAACHIIEAWRKATESRKSAE